MTTTPVRVPRFDSPETPACLVDLDIVARNLERVAKYAAEHSILLRPHAKTHKSPRMATAQLQSGATGVTCATLREAEVMADVCDDVLLAYPVIDRTKVPRATAVASRVNLTLMVDSEEAIHAA